MKRNKWTLGIIIFALFFIATAVVFRISDINILPSQFYGALIGVVITAIITVFLLQGQTSSESQKEQELKKFEKKLDVYQKFFASLENIANEKQIDESRLNQLMFQMGLIRMHTKKENFEEFITKIKEFIDVTNEENIVRDNAAFFKMINEIAEVLRKELYAEYAEEKLEGGSQFDFLNAVSRDSLIAKLYKYMPKKLPKNENMRIWSNNLNKHRLVYEFTTQKDILAVDTFFEDQKCYQEVFYRSKKEVADLENHLRKSDMSLCEMDSDDRNCLRIEIENEQLQKIAEVIQRNHSVIRDYLSK
ncbi:hypothetical protein LJC68_02730 [Bacteroidales bacterium OttesenSCG-928-B11]|nr:hypothetical protein [Bacteroidales bacterium OttesenSCG-928-C03]MDL2311778.1 hypothetical protein [Bacteroidales bacterium OttesenSCG-928-B11]